MDKTAIRPAFFSNLPSLEKVEEEKMTDDERFLYGLSTTSGWPIFTKRKDDLLDDMESLQDAAIANGAPKEEIGENAIIISMARGVINRLWKIIEDAKEANEGGGK
jgi:hypothetical protein